MRYRPLTNTGDYTIGKAWLVNSPACVQQAVLTRLKLFLGEWFVDTEDGTPWLTQVLGERTKLTTDSAIQTRVLGTPGVTSIVSYQSTFDGAARSISVQMTVLTAYSTTAVPISITL